MASSVLGTPTTVLTSSSHLHTRNCSIISIRGLLSSRKPTYKSGGFWRRTKHCTYVAMGAVAVVLDTSTTLGEGRPATALGQPNGRGKRHSGRDNSTPHTTSIALGWLRKPWAPPHADVRATTMKPTPHRRRPGLAD